MRLAQTKLVTDRPRQFACDREFRDAEASCSIQIPNVLEYDRRVSNIYPVLPCGLLLRGYVSTGVSQMKKAILVTACVAAISAFTAIGASSQTTSPTAQDNLSKEKMGKDDTKKNGMETTGMNKDGMAKDSMGKDGMKDMSEDSSPKGMKKDGSK